MKRSIVISILLLTCPAVCWSLPDTYSAGPTWGTIVDAQTNQPISGALVLAMWDLQGGMETSQIATLRIQETLTNADGQFLMPAWGPMKRPSEGFLDTYDPALFVFKAGFLPERLLNNKVLSIGKRINLEVHDSTWNGKAIGLKKYSGPLRPYSQRVGFIVGSLIHVFESEDCSWKTIPKTIRALEDESRREVSAGIDPSFTASSAFLMTRKSCAPFDEFTKAIQESDSK